MSDTPRMDAAIDLCGDYEKPRQYAIRIERAGKKLERELNIALSQVEQLQKQLKAMTEERDCWIANAKNLQVGYNDLDKRIRMMNNSTWPLLLKEK